MYFSSSRHPVSCVVRSADESPDVLLLQRTEIETLDNPPEEHPECSLDTVLKNMLSYGSSAFYERAWWGLCLGVGRGQAGASFQGWATREPRDLNTYKLPRAIKPCSLQFRL